MLIVVWALVVQQLWWRKVDWIDPNLKYPQPWAYQGCYSVAPNWQIQKDLLKADSREEKNQEHDWVGQQL